MGMKTFDEVLRQRFEMADLEAVNAHQQFVHLCDHLGEKDGNGALVTEELVWRARVLAELTSLRRDTLYSAWAQCTSLHGIDVALGKIAEGAEQMTPGN